MLGGARVRRIVGGRSFEISRLVVGPLFAVVGKLGLVLVTNVNVDNSSIK